MEILGEKILAKPIVIANTVYFTSYLPTGGFNQLTCAPSEGGGNLYAVALKNGSATNNFDTTTEDFERTVFTEKRGHSIRGCRHFNTTREKAVDLYPASWRANHPNIGNAPTEDFLV